MTSQSGPAKPTVLDEWLQDAGEVAIGEIVATEQAKIAEGSTPGFVDKHAFLASLRSSHRRTA